MQPIQRLKTTSSRLALTLPILLLTALPMWADDSRPFNGNAEGTILSVTPTPSGFEVTASAAGTATHVGQFTLALDYFMSPTGSFVASGVLTAANGDTITIASTGQFAAGFSAVGTFTVTGGTGRFAGATGGGVSRNMSSGLPAFVMQFDGNISY